MISEFSVAIQHGLTMDDLSRVVHPYPTLSDAVAAATCPACFSVRGSSGHGDTDSIESNRE